MSNSVTSNINKKYTMPKKPYKAKREQLNVDPEEDKDAMIEIVNRFDLIEQDDSVECIEQEDNKNTLTQDNVDDKKTDQKVNIILDEKPSDMGWQVIKKKRSNKRMKGREIGMDLDETVQECGDVSDNSGTCDNIVPEEVITEVIVPDNGCAHLKFKHSYKIWVHGDTQDWGINSFDANFFTIDSVATFLQFFNNFYKFNLNVNSFYIMKSLDDDEPGHIEPTWEHKANRNGGTCSLRIDTIHGIELLQQLCILMVNECLVSDMSLINGISISKKTNWALIKIWTRDKDIDISKLLPYAIINSYPSLCVKSKTNVPEY